MPVKVKDGSLETLDIREGKNYPEGSSGDVCDCCVGCKHAWNYISQKPCLECGRRNRYDDKFEAE